MPGVCAATGTTLMRSPMEHAACQGPSRMSYSDYGASDYNGSEPRPDKALVVKCSYDEAERKISFKSTRTCSYELLRRRVEESFSLSGTAFAITYTDDDGEVTDITTDSDLTEAIRYVYSVHDDPPISSSSSILSGRSLLKGKITLRVRISVEYDGPSLSDTSSLVSLDEYQNRNGSDVALSLGAPSIAEVEDDSITVSSKDMGSKYDLYRARGPKTIVSAPSREPLLRRSPEPSILESPWEVEMSTVPPSVSDVLKSTPSSAQESSLSGINPFSDDQSLGPSSVFDRLRLEEDSSSSFGTSTLHSERGAAWLRDQNARTMKSMLGDPSPKSEKAYAPSTSSPVETESDLSGELALQQDSSGKFYYAYTAGSSYAASQSAPDSGYEDTSDIYHASTQANPALSRPTSMEVNEYDFQGMHTISGGDIKRSSTSSSTFFSRAMSESVLLPEFIHPDVPPEVLQFLPAIPLTPPESPPSCSNCGVILDTIRYVCSTCGEIKPPSLSEKDLSELNYGKGKDRAIDMEHTNGASHSPTHTISSSPSSWSVVSDPYIPLRSLSDSTLNVAQRPLPAIPTKGSSSNGSLASRSTLTVTALNSPYGQGNQGYELCWQCLESAGVTHALEMSVDPGSSPSLMHWPSSPEDAQRAMSQWRRAAPSQKGHLRHAYVEKSWGHKGWQDVEQDENRICKCSTCGTMILNHRYKCASCENFNLCKACYNQVHEVHPSHAFLDVPDRIQRSWSDPSPISPAMPVTDGERSLVHPGVKCTHCMQDIVGARFHCAICDSVDICANCESAGLPGNLDSADGGHDSSHILIKIPYPLGPAELQSASRRAKSVWWGRDAVTGQKMRPRRNSLLSAYDRTVLGTGTHNSSSSTLNGVGSVAVDTDDHGIRCDACGQYIVGVRYQCASCPSKPKPYSLCSNCEEHSYVLHDPMHIFFNFPRPLDRPLLVDTPLIRRLYKYPAGPLDGRYDRDDPKGYLATLEHGIALCDRCMTRINGEWFRCGYCSKDLCGVCHNVDTHNETHAFVVFKSLLDIHQYKRFYELDNPKPIIPYPIYRSM
ncbi:uncharacterized protein FIBRA_02275 [Fibroporia radiculosa]|uniref:ZZ-type domain-containing protein n=1 Tax=Fibroporia radiculosa TaxID=599839 RepID=J4I8Z0_9APHY|nr:uncharacterized protein FIBRA_02275 [Fibroporia radiculosa]CCM00246.1 predicted protein [Fibroporia radiculosa]